MIFSDEISSLKTYRTYEIDWEVTEKRFDNVNGTFMLAHALCELTIRTPNLLSSIHFRGDLRPSVSFLPNCSSHLRNGGTSTTQRVIAITKIVKGIADAQNTLCFVCMLRTSDVFMPSTLATNESGRKMMVMTVNTTAALSRQSWTLEICAWACRSCKT